MATMAEQAATATALTPPPSAPSSAERRAKFPALYFWRDMEANLRTAPKLREVRVGRRRYKHSLSGAAAVDRVLAFMQGHSAERFRCATRVNAVKICEKLVSQRTLLPLKTSTRAFADSGRVFFRLAPAGGDSPARSSRQRSRDAANTSHSSRTSSMHSDSNTSSHSGDTSLARSHDASSVPSTSLLTRLTSRAKRTRRESTTSSASPSQTLSTASPATPTRAVRALNGLARLSSPARSAFGRSVRGASAANGPRATKKRRNAVAAAAAALATPERTSASASALAGQENRDSNSNSGATPLAKRRPPPAATPVREQEREPARLGPPPARPPPPPPSFSATPVPGFGSTLFAAGAALWQNALATVGTASTTAAVAPAPIAPRRTHDWTSASQISLDALTDMATRAFQPAAAAPTASAATVPAALAPGQARRVTTFGATTTFTSAATITFGAAAASSTATATAAPSGATLRRGGVEGRAALRATRQRRRQQQQQQQQQVRGRSVSKTPVWAPSAVVPAAATTLEAGKASAGPPSLPSLSESIAMWSKRGMAMATAASGALATVLRMSPARTAPSHTAAASGIAPTEPVSYSIASPTASPAAPSPLSASSPVVALAPAPSCRSFPSPLQLAMQPGTSQRGGRPVTTQRGARWAEPALRHSLRRSAVAGSASAAAATTTTATSPFANGNGQNVSDHDAREAQIADYVEKRLALEELAGGLNLSVVDAAALVRVATGKLSLLRGFRVGADEQGGLFPRVLDGERPVPDWLRDTCRRIEEHQVDGQPFHSLTVVPDSTRLESVVVFETLAECKDAVRKFLLRLTDPIVPPSLQGAAVRVGQAWSDADVTPALRTRLLQAWFVLLPARHQTLLSFLAAHWHRLATCSRDASNAISRLADTAAGMLVRKAVRGARQPLQRLAEAVIAQPELLAAPATLQRDAQLELQRLAKERPSWLGAWPMLPPHTKDEARSIDLGVHAFLAGLVGLADVAEASSV